VGEVLLYTLSFVLSIAVPATIVRRDLARLRWSAVVVFGPLSVPIHFIRTRRSWVGLLLAILWLIGAILLVALPVEALGRIFGIGD
jgi:hypothetical protein